MKNYEKEASLIRKDERRDEFNLYTYELSVRRGLQTACFRIPLYSVTVSMTDAYGKTSTRSLTDVFADAGKALKFYEKIVKHLASPIDLPYVLEDEGVV